MTLDEFRAGLRLLGEARVAQIVRRESLREARETQGRSRRLATERLRVRTGYLRRSIVGEIREGTRGLDLVLRAGGSGGGRQPVRYARLQESGGIVRPKTRSWLTIPQGPALTPAGVHRYHSARDVPGLRFVPVDGSRAYLVRDRAGSRSAGAHSEIWYVLVRRVQIRAHRYLRDPFGELRRRLPESLARALVDALRRIDGQ